ncbi:MAG: hypothetical protein K2Y27_27810 [Xanthobacteraceae bacterium]|nr:hypothetical protein [Xanthobacteraceae bacterium]
MERTRRSPRKVTEAIAREQETRHSGCTRAGTGQFKRVQNLRHARRACSKPAKGLEETAPKARLLGTVADRKIDNIADLICRARNCEGREPRVLAAAHAATRARRLPR